MDKEWYVKMRERRKTVVLIFAAALPLVILAQCVDTYPGIEKDGIDQKIIFIESNVNYSGLYQNSGVFVDDEGNMVEYDLSNGGWRDSTFEERLFYLENMEYDESDVIMKINMSELGRNFSYLYKVNPDAKIKEKFRAYDAGQRALYGVAYLEEGIRRLRLYEYESLCEEDCRMVADVIKQR